jgi:hypothetical protein
VTDRAATALAAHEEYRAMGYVPIPIRLDIQATAAAAMDFGWMVFPVYGPDSAQSGGCSCGDPECHSPGKHPTTRRGLHDASRDFDLIEEWWPEGSDRGLAVATGHPSDVWVLDSDGETGAGSLAALTDVHGRLPPTVTARTGGGGRHLFFRMPSDRDVRSSASRVAPSIDVRGTGGYVVVPPSLHVSGQRYTWISGRGPEDVAPAHAPGWLLELVAPPAQERTFAPLPVFPESRGFGYVAAAIAAECAELATAPEGCRNDRLNRAAFALARFVADGEADASSVVRSLAHAAGRAGLSEREIERTLRSAFRARGAA